MLKIAYISQPAFADVDISFLSVLQKKVDVYYFIPIRKGRLRGTAIDIKELHPHTGIFKADIYPELRKFANLINLDKVYVVNCTSKYGWSVRHLWVNWLLFDFLKKNRFDVIHLTMFPCYFEGLFYLFSRKIVLTVHDPFPHKGEVSSFNNLYRNLAFRLFSHFIILNRRQRENFIEFYNLQSKNVYSSRLGCYTYLRSCEYNLLFNTQRKYILFFGRITPYKGLDDLLFVMEEIHKSYPDVDLVVAGKGSYPFDISHFEKLPYIVLLNRFIVDNELASLIRNSLFVVCPYTEATQSGVIMSSFAFCKAVIATDVGGLPEMVVDKKFGLIVPPKNRKRLKDAIVDLLTNDNLLAIFENNIRSEFFIGNSSWNKICDEMLCIYNEVIGK